MTAPSLLTVLLVLLLSVTLARRFEISLARLAIPAIVLELALGFLLGNTILPFDRIAPLAGITELGVLTLFFRVGLELRGDLIASRRVAILRTVALSSLVPLITLWPLQAWFGMEPSTALLCMAVVSATGTGVTLRVLAQQRVLQDPSSRLLVGVSVLDDLPAIAYLSWAIATGNATTARALASGNLIPGWPGLLVGVLLATGLYQLVRFRVRRSGPRPVGPLGVMLLLVGMAWLGEATGISSFMGALFGGVLLARLAPVDESVSRLLAVFSEVFLPLYFVGVGLRVEASTLLQPQAWTLAVVLLLMAVISKLLCGLGVSATDRAEGVDPWLVIFGLMPRGVPGLVFASRALSVGLISAVQFSALVLMVTLTTIGGLMLLSWRLQQRRRAGLLELDPAT